MSQLSPHGSDNMGSSQEKNFDTHSVNESSYRKKGKKRKKRKTYSTQGRWTEEEHHKFVEGTNPCFFRDLTGFPTCTQRVLNSPSIFRQTPIVFGSNLNLKLNFLKIALISHEPSIVGLRICGK